MRVTGSYAISILGGFASAFLFSLVVDSIIIDIIVGVIAAFVLYKLWRKLEELLHEKVERPIGNAIGGAIYGGDSGRDFEYMTNHAFDYEISQDKEMVQAKIVSMLTDLCNNWQYTILNKPSNSERWVKIADNGVILIRIDTIIGAIHLAEKEGKVEVKYHYAKHLLNLDSLPGITRTQLIKGWTDNLERIRICIFDIAKSIDPTVTETVSLL